MMPRGWQPPNRYPSKRVGAGSLRFHAIGCSTDGGPGLPPGACRKCAESADVQFFQLLKRVDSYTPGR